MRLRPGRKRSLILLHSGRSRWEAWESPEICGMSTAHRTSLAGEESSSERGGREHDAILPVCMAVRPLPLCGCSLVSLLWVATATGRGRTLHHSQSGWRIVDEYRVTVFLTSDWVLGRLVVSAASQCCAYAGMRVGE